MKKVAAVLSVLAAVMLCAAPAAAARQVTKTYGTPAVGQGDTASACLLLDPPLAPCPTFALLPGESLVDAVVEDLSGMPVYTTIAQDLNADGLWDITMNFCGSTTRPFEAQEPAVGPKEVAVMPHLLPGAGDLDAGPAPCVGVATSGTVRLNIG